MTFRVRAALFLSSAVLFPLPLFAGTQASIKVEQLSASQYGVWTLISGDGSSKASTDEGVDRLNYSFGLTEFGPTTLSVKAPAGMSTKISVYRGGDLIEMSTSNQYSFNIYANDNYRFIVQYSLTRVGSLGVTSDPSPLRFRMKGPSGRTLTATTPHTFQNLPAGKYSLSFGKTDTCLAPAVQTVKVEPEQRNTTMVTLPCNIVEEQNVDRTRVSKRTLQEYAKEREMKKRGERK